MEMPVSRLLMAKQVLTLSDFSGTDVKSLFSHFGAFAQKAQYQELVREEAALNASNRWPLLAELQGISATDADKTEQS